MTRWRLSVVCLCLSLLAAEARAQTQVPFVGMGDSTGENVGAASHLESHGR